MRQAVGYAQSSPRRGVEDGRLCRDEPLQIEPIVAHALAFLPGRDVERGVPSVSSIQVGA